MTMTDDDLNRAMAEACGWTNIHDRAYTPTGETSCGTKPGAVSDAWGEGRTYIPRYCTDRNCLPEIWNQVRTNGRDYGFVVALNNLLRKDAGGQISHFDLITAPIRYHVIAALEAMDKWPDWWE